VTVRGWGQPPARLRVASRRWGGDPRATPVDTGGEL